MRSTTDERELPTPAGREELLVSTEWLAAHLDDPAVRVFDLRYYFDRPGRAAYDQGHIPGALYLDWSVDLTDAEGAFEYAVARREQVEATLGRLGVSASDLIVGYDDEGGHFASRLWWTLALYGHDRVRVLEGGITRWVAEGRPLTTEVPVARPTALRLTAPGRPGILATAEDVLAALGDPNARVLDVRRRSEYDGSEVRARRGGHVPGALHLFWQDNLDWDGLRTFRPEEELRERYRAAGVTPEQRIITYCQGGVRAAHSMLTLKLLGYPNVAVYDGSWAEWGNRSDLPIEGTGAAPEPDASHPER